MVSDVVPEMAHRLAGHTLVRKVGEGAMAEVWEAWGPDGETVALKILKPEKASDPENVRDFENEADATASVSHENVVTVYGRGEEDGQHWIRMEFVDGPCLADLLAKRKRLPWKPALSIAIQVGKALAHAHGKGLVHRDVKPDNILLRKDARARLTDFGIVKDVSTLKGYLLPGKKVGTPAYASPEQCLGKRMTPATDVYSLGATLYHMVTGRTPFGGGTRSEIMRRTVQGTLVPPEQVVADLPKAVSKVIERLMARRVLERPETMEQVVHDLTLVRAGKFPIGMPRRRG